MPVSLCPRQDSNLLPSAPEAESVRLRASAGVWGSPLRGSEIDCAAIRFVRIRPCEYSSVRGCPRGESRTSCDIVVTRPAG
jgi:hypothetical protein